MLTFSLRPSVVLPNDGRLLLAAVEGREDSAVPCRRGLEDPTDADLLASRSKERTEFVPSGVLVLPLLESLRDASFALALADVGNGGKAQS